jgi:hypothetical protein
MIIDTEYQSIFYRDLAFKELTKFYRELAPDDDVGFICLESRAKHREIILERKDMNIKVKEKLLRSVAQSEPEFVLNTDSVET